MPKTKIKTPVASRKKQKKRLFPPYNLKMALFVGAALIIVAGLLYVGFGRAASEPTVALKDDGSVCIAPTAYPSVQPGGMQYLSYTTSVTDLNRVEAKFRVDSSMAATEKTYLQLYESDLGASHQYFGVQTDAPNAPNSQLLIFSKFIKDSEQRPGSTSEVRVTGGGSYPYVAAYEGNFVSLRRVTPITTQTWHTVEVKRAEAASLTLNGKLRNGDWYDYYYDGVNIGGIWFERTEANSITPAAMKSQGLSWTEFWGVSSGVQTPVPKQQFSLKPVKFNGGYGYSKVISTYSTMPNSDTSYTTDQPYVGDFTLKMGGDTQRCHPTGQQITVDTAVSSPSSAPTPAPASPTAAPATPTPTKTPVAVIDNVPPTKPSGLTRSLSYDYAALSYYMELKWAASIDNTGVKDYAIKKNGTVLGSTVNTTFRDYKLAPNNWYTYEVQARDGAGNLSAANSTSAIGRCFLIWCWLD